MGRLATDIFLKGYQWPFDPQRIAGRRFALIDMLVQNEMVVRGRRVWMDFRPNPVATDGLEAFASTRSRPRRASTWSARARCRPRRSSGWRT